MSANKLPPFQSLLKSRDVEDPVNLWVHRPLAYAFVLLFYRTPLTPNQITFLSMLVGLFGAACWFDGRPVLMIWGGVLLWASAILDGADGIMARAKQMSSDVGRAIDGTADVVGAAAGLLAASYHMWVKHESWLEMALVPVVVVTSIYQIYLYDFYKESYMTMTNPTWDGRPERIEDVRAKLRDYKQRKQYFLAWVTYNYLGLITGQTRVVGLTNPAGAREHLRFSVNERTAEDYRKVHRGPMKLWALVSLAPHCYLLSIFGMLDRLDLYLWFRALGINTVFVSVMVWQRHASRRTRELLEQQGMAPVPA